MRMNPFDIIAITFLVIYAVILIFWERGDE